MKRIAEKKINGVWSIIYDVNIGMHSTNHATIVETKGVFVCPSLLEFWNKFSKFVEIYFFEFHGGKHNCKGCCVLVP